MTTVGEVAAFLERLYPPASAESWDQVGLAIGNRAQQVRRIHYTVDVTSDVIAEASAAGAQLIIAHHPVLLRGIHAVDHDHPKGRLIMESLQAQLSVFCAHTNADKPEHGVSDAIARRLGLVDARPLQPDPGPALDKITCFVPADHEDRILAAIGDAGAGALGDYDSCSFSSPGTGRFRPLEGSDPFVGTVGEVSAVPEVRIEAVLPRSRRTAVVSALLEAHPYEEPAWDVVELAGTPSSSGLGRIGELPEPMPASRLAELIAERLPATVSGVRLAGDPARTISRLALLGGAGDSMLDDARRAGADAYLTSDLRHHPAQEAVEHSDAMVLLDVAHWAAEWCWLPVVKELVEAEFTLEGTVSELPTDPWTFSAGARADR